MSLTKLNIFIFVLLIFFSCKKDQVVEIIEISGPIKICQGEQQVEFSVNLKNPVEYVLWTVPDDAIISTGQGTSKIIVNFGNKGGTISAKAIENANEGPVKKMEVVIDCIPNKWCRIKDFSGTKRVNAVGFSINDKGYILGGYGINSTNWTNATNLLDLWQFNATDQTWEQRSSNFNSDAGILYVRQGANFVLDNMFYIIAYDLSYNTILKCYNPATNSWVSKNTCPLYMDSDVSSCFVVNNKAYVCFGYDYSSTQPEVYNIWQYEPSSDTWLAKNGFTDQQRGHAMAFSINNVGYICGGYYTSNNNTTRMNDLYKYDEVNDTWSKINTAPFSENSRGVFCINDKAYFVAGTNQSGVKTNLTYSYDPATNMWANLSPFPGKKVNYPSTFVINGKAYMGLGVFYNEVYNSDLYTNEFYTYCP